MDDNNLAARPYRREETPMPEPPNRELSGFGDDDEVPFHVPRD
jgi:hypothetical protein